MQWCYSLLFLPLLILFSCHKPAAVTPPAPKVVVKPVFSTKAPYYLDFVGHVEANQTVEVRSQVAGIIDGQYFTEVLQGPNYNSCNYVYFHPLCPLWLRTKEHGDGEETGQGDDHLLRLVRLRAADARSGRGADEARGHPLHQLNGEIDRGDRHHDPARAQDRAARLLSS